MYFFPSPAMAVQMMTLSVQGAMMLAEAQAVMAMRLAGMAGFWRVTPAENGRMLTEKLEAMQAAGLAATQAAMAGRSLPDMAEAALKPIRRRTRANAARLTKRGPGKPG